LVIYCLLYGLFGSNGREGRRGNLMEGRGGEGKGGKRRGDILIKYMFGSNEGRGREVKY
jgi:hypothetical protein